MKRMATKEEELKGLSLNLAPVFCFFFFFLTYSESVLLPMDLFCGIKVFPQCKGVGKMPKQN